MALLWAHAPSLCSYIPISTDVNEDSLIVAPIIEYH